MRSTSPLIPFLRVVHAAPQSSVDSSTPPRPAAQPRLPSAERRTAWRSAWTPLDRLAQLAPPSPLARTTPSSPRPIRAYHRRTGGWTSDRGGSRSGAVSRSFRRRRCAGAGTRHRYRAQQAEPDGKNAQKALPGDRGGSPVRARPGRRSAPEEDADDRSAPSVPHWHAPVHLRPLESIRTHSICDCRGSRDGGPPGTSLNVPSNPSRRFPRRLPPVVDCGPPHALRSGVRTSTTNRRRTRWRWRGRPLGPIPAACGAAAGTGSRRGRATPRPATTAARRRRRRPRPPS